MTSKNSSLVKRHGMQNLLIKRRLWAELLLLLVFVVAFIAIPALDIVQTRSWFLNDSEAYTQTYINNMYMNTAESFFGYNGYSYALTFFAAALLGLESFAWLDSKKQVDFYMSQPVKLSGRFWGTSLNSLIIFVCIYAVTAAVGTGISIALGVSASLIKIALAEFFRCIALFAAVYGIAVLSVMLTGNIIIAGLAFLTLSFYEMIVRNILDSLAGVYFKTYYYGNSDATNITSPLAWYNYFDDWRGILANIVFAAIVLLIAWLVFRKRKNEDAGKAVLHKPVRVIVKILIAVLAGLVVAVSVAYMGGIWVTAISAALAAFIMSMIMEVIYNYNVKKCTKGLGWSVLTVVLAAGIVLVFAYDLTGYDSWIPETDDVIDAYIAYDAASDALYDVTGYGYSAEDFAKQNMHLTDVEAVNEILDIGEEFTREDSFEEPSYWLIIGYRMNNGKVKARSVNVPCSADPELLSSVFSSEEFEKYTYPIYNDDVFTRNIEYMTIGYNFFGRDNNYIYDGALYTQLREAYLQDMEQFDYEFARVNAPIGFINVNCENEEDPVNDYYYMSLPVYGQFDNTINILKQYGIYSDMINDYDMRSYGPFNEYIEFVDYSEYEASACAVG